ncbi:hypothetical protein [Methyloversatilis sp.]|uniref:hypothetical protein n=1 Tax=Methyloversatilis sp. TaxID=2569862 RepID=UPI0035AFC3E5
MNMSSFSALTFAAIALLSPAAHAAGDLGKQEAIGVTIRMGTEGDQPRFTPDSLTLETGKLYALRLQNAGDKPYYFGSQGLADAVYTRKVVAMDAAGKVVAEVYGPIRRIEVAAGHSVEWWFLPVRTGRFEDVMSTKSLAEAGMRAVIEVR